MRKLDCEEPYNKWYTIKRKERKVKILVTGAKGMVGTALVNNLKTLQDGRNKTRPNIRIDEIYEYDIDSTYEELEEAVGYAHLYGVKVYVTVNTIIFEEEITINLVSLLEVQAVAEEQCFCFRINS